MEGNVFYDHVWQSDDSADDRDISHGWGSVTEKGIFQIHILCETWNQKQETCILTHLFQRKNRNYVDIS